MSFADEVRNNYTPKQQMQPESVDYNKVATRIVNLEKECLMNLAKAGRSEDKASGLFGIKKRAVIAYRGVHIDKNYRTVGISTYEGDYCDIVAHSKIMYMKLYSEIQKLCRINGINVEVDKRKNTTSYRFTLMFWIEL